MKVLKKILIVPVLLLAISLSACADADRKKLAQASQDFASGVTVTLSVDQALIDQGLIERDDAAALTGAILDVSNAGAEFNRTAQTVSLSGAGKTLVLGKLTALADAAGRLEAAGTLHIKNSQARLQFQAGVAVIKVAIGVAQSVLGASK